MMKGIVRKSLEGRVLIERMRGSKNVIMIGRVVIKGKGKVKQSRYRPGVAQRVPGS
jgi:hypothetical protein